MNTVDLSVRNEVTVKNAGTLLTGTYASLPGFRYDLRFISSYEDFGSRYLESISSHSIGLKDGFSQTDWLSGVVTGCKFSEIKPLNLEDLLTWCPVYTTGTYSVYWNVRQLYSDYSCTGSCTLDDTWDLSSLVLRDDRKEDSISCALYSRDENGLICAEVEYKFVEEFTGELDGTERLVTEDPDFILENFSTRFNEFVIRDDKLYCNRIAQVQVGYGNDLSSITQSWERLTPSAGGYSFLRYLNPIDVTVVSINNNVITLIPEVDLSAIEASDYGYQLGELGALKFSGESANAVILKAAIDADDVEITCSEELNFKAFPSTGIIQIGSEYIHYAAKTNGKLVECTRGYFSSTAASHTLNSIILFIDRGTFVEGIYYVKYTAVPRVDYEITAYGLRRANSSNWLDIHPFSNLKSNKIVQITSKTVNLDSLVLSTDSLLIGGNLYGPVYFGTDVSRLICTALDSYGSPIPEIEITIEQLSGPGDLNYNSEQVIAESNSSGQVYAVFNAPYGNESALIEITDIVHDGSDTIITIDSDSLGLIPNDVTLFQILKHDPSRGTVGKRVTAFAGGAAALPNGLGYIDCRTVYTEDFNEGFLQIDIDSVRYTFVINKARRIEGDTPYTRFYLTTYNAALLDITESTTWLYQAEAEVWDPELKRGAEVLVYEWSTDFQHPVTEDPGAYGPVWPDAIQGRTLIYEDRLLPIPDAEDDTINLGGYKVIAPREARFKASARDPFSGETVVSNEIRLKIEIPQRLSGVDRTGILPIPYGFTFVSDDFNVGISIGGSNFLTVNPRASGINQFTLRGNNV